MFGATNNNPTNTFANKSTSLFGQSAPTNTFGQPNAFGSTNTFAALNPQPQQQTSLFGQASTNNMFGMSQPSSLFGAPSSNQTSTFGSLAPSTSTTNFFGSNLNANKPTLFSNPSTNTFGQSNAFGSIASAPFGSLNTQPQQSSLFGQNSASTLFATNQQSQIDSSNIITRLQTLPYGSPQLLVDSSSSPGGVKTKFTTDPKTLNQYKINAKAQAEVKVQRIPAAGKPTTLLFDGLDDESADNLKCAQDIFLPRPSIKKLVLNKNNTSLFKSSSFIKSPVAKENEVPFSNKENRSPEVVANTVPKQVPVLDNTIDVIYKLSNEVAKQDAHNSTGSSAEKSFTFEPLNSTATEEVIVVNNYIPKCGIILNRTDYYTIPSIEQCDAFYDAENDSCIVDSFTVGRVDYGSIFWKGPLNVKGINLDEIVHIRRKEVIVYPDDEAKPTIGEGLNRPAQITLDQVWPIDKTSREFIKDVNRLRAMKYADKVEAATIKLDATFKEYRPDTGSWVFTVKHFSKYGLDADDEDIDMDQQQQQQQQQPPTKVNQNGLQNRNISTRESTNENYNHFISAPVELFPKGQNFLPNGFGGPLPKFGGDMQTSTRDLPSNYIYGTIHEDELDDDNDAEIDLNQTKELSLMRSAFFLEQDEEVDTVTKKCKNMSFTKSTTSHQIIPSLFPSKFKSTIPKRRKLEFEAVPSQNKANIYSVTYSTAPKVNFFNGSNRFCIVYGGRVLIFKANFLEPGKEKDEERKLQEHLTLNSEFISSNNSRFPPMIKTNKFSLIVGADVHLNSLIEALYGELSETLDFCRYQERIRRIVNWLFTYNKTLPVPEKKFDRIMHFLTTNELEFAVTESVNSKQPRLSYLLASGQYVNKDLIMSQLDHWKRSGSDAFIEHDLLKLYILLSGQSSWTLSTGQTVEVFEGLEWTQQLILLLLYKNLDVKDTEMFETNLVKSAISLLTVTPKCVEYYLLAQSEPWVAISACTGLLDSWLLHESLFSFNVIAEDIFNNKSDSIHLHLASQAKDLRWALFFALHIRNDFTRYHFVMDLLVRNSPQLMDTEVEKFLVDKLAVDKQLISDAKLLFIKDCPKASRL